MDDPGGAPGLWPPPSPPHAGAKRPSAACNGAGQPNEAKATWHPVPAQDEAEPPSVAPLSSQPWQEEPSSDTGEGAGTEPVPAQANGHGMSSSQAVPGAAPSAAVAQPPSWSVLPPKGAATAELCCYCFQVLRARLQGQSLPSFPVTADPLFRAPLFITWLKQRRGGLGTADLEVRGCIGCLEPIVLSPGLSEYALRSSLQDRRFPPVRLEEVPSLTCKLSILHAFEACSHAHDWQIGLHGILIKFQDAEGRQYSATYLPEVAREHGMTREVAIRELVVKAGYSGPCGGELISRMEVTRYQTLVETVAYWEYLCSSGSDVLDPGHQY